MAHIGLAAPDSPPRPAAGPGGQQTPPEAGGSATPPKPAEPAARPPDDSATPPPAVDFTGHWEHASGLTFSLTQTGAEVTGAWDGFSSTIRGTVRGAVLEWTTVSAEGVEYHGTATLAAGGKAISGEGTAVKPDSQRGRRFRLDADRLP